jgi:hypothetical protein
LEILVGSISSLAVPSIIWPRYAREEFFQLRSKALETAAEIVSLEAASYIQLRDRSDEIEQLWTRFEQQASTLRNLLQAGAQESTRFYGRLGNYNAFVVSLTNLFQAALHLETKRLEESHFGPFSTNFSRRGKLNKDYRGSGRPDRNANRPGTYCPPLTGSG